MFGANTVSSHLEITIRFTLNDEDWQSLYITAQTSVYKIKVNIPGISLA